MTVADDDFQSIFVHFLPGPHIDPSGQAHPPVGTLAQTISASYGIDWHTLPPAQAQAETDRRIAARARLVALVRAHRESHP